MSNQTDNMKYFKFDRAWMPIFRCLSFEDRGVLLNWIFWYYFEDSGPDEETLEKSNFPLFNAWKYIKAELLNQYMKYND